MHAPLSTLEIVDRLGMAALVLSVAGTLGFLAFLLTFGALGVPLDLFGTTPPRREGLELVLFPLGVLAATVLVRSPQRCVGAINTSWIGPWPPIMAALVLLGIALLMVRIFELPETAPLVTPERVLGAAIIAAAGFAGAVLYPRLAAILAGALAAPAVFGLLTIPIPERVLRAEGPDAEVYNIFVLVCWIGGPLALGAAWYLLRPRVVSHAAWAAGVMLVVAVWSYLWAVHVVH